MQRVVETFRDPQRFSCFLVTNPNNTLAVDTALRYWGCATQAGLYVAGTFYPFSSPNESSANSSSEEKFAPLSVAGVPFISFDSPNWDEALGKLSQSAKGLMDGASQAKPLPHPVVFDQGARTVTLFLPGFNKSDVKLSQVFIPLILCLSSTQRLFLSDICPP